MPSRSRRGGPGVGISDVDTHILETLRRRRACTPPLFSPSPVQLTRVLPPSYSWNPPQLVYLFFPWISFLNFSVRYCSTGENEPLVPAHTQFLLTTDSARVRTFGDAAAGADASQLNTSAYERYFDKPEVIRDYREQQLIQTPEFTLLSEHEAVGGRFRPRSLEDVRACVFSLGPLQSDV